MCDSAAVEELFMIYRTHAKIKKGKRSIKVKEFEEEMLWYFEYDVSKYWKHLLDEILNLWAFHVWEVLDAGTNVLFFLDMNADRVGGDCRNAYKRRGSRWLKKHGQ